MLIGNRRRPQMQRTTSITRIITLEIDDDDDDHQTIGQETDVTMAMDQDEHQRFLAMFSPGNHRRNERKDGGRQSSSPTSSFLGNCGFCKSPLAPGRDIYMYKGDAAFCSVECREQQMEHDEGKTRNHVSLSRSN